MEKKKNGYDWFVAIVTPNTEKKAKKRLDDLVADWKKAQVIDETEKVSAYVPIQKEVRIQPSTGRRVVVDIVLAPCYLFIYCKDSLRYKIACEANFILHFMMDRATILESGKNDFARIPEAQMNEFMRMVGDADTPVTIDTKRLRLGSKVRIKTGRLKGLEGNFYEDPSGSTMLAFRVNFLGYAKMNCPLDLLELVE